MGSDHETNKGDHPMTEDKIVTIQLTGDELEAAAMRGETPVIRVEQVDEATTEEGWVIRIFRHHEEYSLDAPFRGVDPYPITQTIWLALPRMWLHQHIVRGRHHDARQLASRMLSLRCYLER